MLSPDLEMNVSCTGGRMFSSSSCPKANCWLVVLIFVVTKKLMKTLLYSSLVCPYVPVFVFIFFDLANKIFTLPNIDVHTEHSMQQLNLFTAERQWSLCCKIHQNFPFFFFFSQLFVT